MKNNKPIFIAGFFAIFFTLFLVLAINLSNKKNEENYKKVVFEVKFTKIKSCYFQDEEISCLKNYSQYNSSDSSDLTFNKVKISVKSSDGTEFKLKTFKPKITFFDVNGKKTSEQHEELARQHTTAFPYITSGTPNFNIYKDPTTLSTLYAIEYADKVEIEYLGQKFTFESEEFKIRKAEIKKEQDKIKLKEEQAKKEQERDAEARKFSAEFSKKLEEAARNLEDVANDPNASNREKYNALSNLNGLYNKCLHSPDYQERYKYEYANCHQYKRILDRYEYVYKLPR